MKITIGDLAIEFEPGTVIEVGPDHLSIKITAPLPISLGTPVINYPFNQIKLDGFTGPATSGLVTT